MRMSLAFGPVPSRRLGRSLGINNIPAKTCSYSCIYCQLGNTAKTRVERQRFYEPEQILREVDKKISLAKFRGEQVDYLTFVPDGEPTLDLSLREEIACLGRLGIKIAVICNASLLDREDVKEDLAKADLVSLKIDTVDEGVWCRVNRPNRLLKHDLILDEVLEFAKGFRGDIITETMLMANINDTQEEVRRIADYLSRLMPTKAYVAVPTRPPVETWVRQASEWAVNMAYQAFSEALGEGRTEYLVGYEGNAFSSMGDPQADLLSIVSVHPMREDAVALFLKEGNADWNVVRGLIRKKEIIELEYREHKFYVRRFPGVNLLKTIPRRGDIKRAIQ
jgi:wyosine [tRNA(Phe)-imidazoG37] synthetase (radical SAM superfamily)